MKRITMTVVLPLLAASLLLAGCGAADDGDTGGMGAERADTEAGPATEGGREGMLQPPFTAEQIRDAWQPGLSVVMRSETPHGTVDQRWDVVSADETGVEIRFTALEGGGPSGEPPRVERSTWDDLRDHAVFPAGLATREEAVRDTPLGKLDGWVYTVKQPEAGTVTEYFFANSLPGPPVTLQTMQDGEPLMAMSQTERTPAR